MHRTNIELEKYPQTLKEVQKKMKLKRQELHVIEPKRSKKLKSKEDSILNRIFPDA